MRRYDIKKIDQQTNVSLNAELAKTIQRLQPQTGSEILDMEVEVILNRKHQLMALGKQWSPKRTFSEAWGRKF